MQPGKPRGRRGRLLTYACLALAASFLMLGMTGQPTPAALPFVPAIAKQPMIMTDAETGGLYTYLSVLIFNVADDPWPISLHRADALRQIRLELAAWRRLGTAPDVVLLQEAFTPKSYLIGQEAGYAHSLGGPEATDQAEALSGPQNAAFLANREFWKGETLGKMTASGLYAFSDYPVVERIAQPFKQDECAGYDCLANKGMLMIRIAVPGVPVPVDVVTTHLNSRHSSGVPDERSLYAHNRQIDELALFLKTHHDETHPLLFGGDFNIRNNPDRLSYTISSLSYPFVGAYCERYPHFCHAPPARSRAEAWYNSEDQQGFEGTPAVQIRPVSARAVFDQPVNGKMLSDHKGYLVVYRIAWSSPTPPKTIAMNR